MITYRIPLRGVKVSTNKIYAGTHWISRKAIKDRIYDCAESFCQPVKKIRSYPVKIEYRFFFATKAFDSSNCSYMVKMFEDALCTLGIIKDDAPQFVASTFISVAILPTQKGSQELDEQGEKVDAKDRDYLEIIITKYEDQHQKNH